MGNPRRSPHAPTSIPNSQPYRVTVFTTPTSRARKISTSDTPSTFEDAAALARKAAFVALLRNIFLIILSITTLLFALSMFLPRLHPFSQEGLPQLRHSLQQVEAIDMRHKVLGYDRSEFGNDWAVPLGSTCNTRQHVIFSQSAAATDCASKSAELFDPYSQTHIPTSDIEVDHIFPLSAAWDHGAYAWDDETRKNFANDPLNLVATSRSLNQSKSDSLPDEWLPPHPAARCWYSERLAAIAAAYSLSLSEASLSTMNRQCQLGIPIPW